MGGKTIEAYIVLICVCLTLLYHWQKRSAPSRDLYLAHKGPAHISRTTANRGPINTLSGCDNTGVQWADNGHQAVLCPANLISAF